MNDQGDDGVEEDCQNFDISFGSGDPHCDAEDDGPDNMIERTRLSGNGGQMEALPLAGSTPFWEIFPGRILPHADS